MKIQTLASISVAAAFFPGLAFADLVDFGTTTKAHKAGGFVVTGVFQGTPAASLGLAEGDVVTRLDGHKLQPTASLARLIAGVREADSEVAVNWQRGDEQMSGKAVLSSTLSDEAFNERYPKAAAKSSKRKPMVVGGNNLDDMEEQLKGLGIDVSEIEKQLKKAFEGSDLDDLLGKATTSYSVSKMMSSSNGSTVTVEGAGDKKHVTIKSKDGKTIFDDDITIKELDKVPAGERETVKGLMGGDIDVIIRGTTGGRSSAKGSDGDVEESTADLLKKLEESEKKDAEKKEK